jgi:hypothetical protein
MFTGTSNTRSQRDRSRRSKQLDNLIVRWESAGFFLAVDPLPVKFHIENTA